MTMLRQTPALRVRGPRGCGGLVAGFGLQPRSALDARWRARLRIARSTSSSSPRRAATPTVSARGRILYDFSGNACEGYALQFRQVSELDNGEGKVTLSDLRTTTWEDGAAKKLVFKSQNYLNQTTGRYRRRRGRAPVRQGGRQR